MPNDYEEFSYIQRIHNVPAFGWVLGVGFAIFAIWLLSLPVG